MPSPFAPYANATLRFPVITGTLSVDPATGNRKPERSTFTVTAILNQKTRSNPAKDIPGVDISAAYLEGYAIDPMLLPSVIPRNDFCEAEWDGKVGRFYLLLEGRSAYGVAPITGEKIKGYFEVSQFLADGEPWVPDPTGGEGLMKISFSYGDSTPKLIARLDAGRTVFTAQIVIQVPFNGTGASLALGDASVSDRLMKTNQSDPTFAAEYETNPGQTYSVATDIFLTIVPGTGCTQGSGYILLEV